MKTLVQCVIIGIMAFMTGCTGIQLEYINSAITCADLTPLHTDHGSYTWHTGDTVTYQTEGDKVIGVFRLRPKGGAAEFSGLSLVAYFATDSCVVVAKNSKSWTRGDNITFGEDIEFEIDIPKTDQKLTKILFTYKGVYDG